MLPLLLLTLNILVLVTISGYLFRGIMTEIGNYYFRLKRLHHPDCQCFLENNELIRYWYIIIWYCKFDPDIDLVPWCIPITVKKYKRRHSAVHNSLKFAFSMIPKWLREKFKPEPAKKPNPFEYDLAYSSDEEDSPRVRRHRSRIRFNIFPRVMDSTATTPSGTSSTSY